MKRLKEYFLISLLVIIVSACGGGGSDSKTNLSENEDNGKGSTVSQKKGLGALIPTEDMLYDIPLAMPPVSSYASNELPLSFDLSDKMPPVRSQGGQGSCASWAVGYYLKSYHEHIDKESDYGQNSNHKGVYSPAFLYNSVKVNGCDSGSYISANLERVRDIGIATWEDMPYDENECDTTPSTIATTNAKCARILDYSRIRIHQPIESIEMQDMKYYLSHGSPLVIGIRVFDGFNNPKRVDGEFFYKDYEEKGNSGGHAIVVVGYDDNKNAFKIINSWGTGWGNNGYLWIDYDVFSRIVFVAYRTEDALDECEEGSSYISIDKQSLVFNTKLINNSYKKSFKISNSGSVEFAVSDITVPNGYSVDWKSGTILPNKTQTVTVTFTPTEDKTYNGKITIIHNADKGSSSINLIGAGIDGSSSNLPPIAKAGADITVKVGEIVKLDASKSSDDGEIIKYEWKLGDTLLSNSKIFEKSDFTIGTHRVILKVTDDKGLTDTDIVVVTISNKENLDPIANAGENISVKFGKSVTFDGSKSKDTDGNIVSYEWKEGDKVLSTSAKFTKNDFSVGKHTITLTVTDNSGATDNDIVIVTIAKEGNNAPVANAGEDITITLGNDIRFDASKSKDDGEIVTYTWSSPSLRYDIVLHHPTTTYKGLRLPVGKHTFTLIVTDNDGQTNTDTMLIKVEASNANLKPAIFISAYNKTLDISLSGNSYNVIRPRDTLKLSARSSYDADGEITSYEWKEGTTILGKQDTLIKSNLSIGEHIITLTITDNDGEKNNEDITITVGRENNINPIARAGNDKILVLGEKLDLDASNSNDEDGEIIYYYFKYKNGYCHCSSSSKLSFYPEIDKVGEYTFTLIVLDNNGAIDTDTITVTVVE